MAQLSVAILAGSAGFGFHPGESDVGAEFSNRPELTVHGVAQFRPRDADDAGESGDGIISVRLEFTGAEGAADAGGYCGGLFVHSDGSLVMRIAPEPSWKQGRRAELFDQLNLGPRL